MTDKIKVYTKVLKMLKEFLPTTSQYHIVVLSMMVAGIVLGKNAQLSKISFQIPSKAKPASLAKRFHRFVKNPNIASETIYLPFAKLILTHLGNKITVSMDATQVGQGCMALVIAVIYKKRAIPLVWFVYKAKKGHTTADNHIEALKLLKPLISTETSVTLLGDGEYDTVDMLKWVEKETNWTYIVRTASNILITEKDDPYQINVLLVEKNTIVSRRNVGFTSANFKIQTAIAWWEDPYKNGIFLISNSKKKAKKICKKYRRRFKIETMFSDQKGRGFNLHKTHLRHPERVSRLILATAISYIWMLFLGVEVLQDEARRSIIDRNDRRDKSLFRLGLDWFEYALTNGLDFKVLFHPPTLFSEGVR